MNTITVSASRTYDVHISQNLIDAIGEYIHKIHAPCNVCIVSDSNVWPFYGKIVTDSLKEYGYCPISYVLDAGEEIKSGENFLDLLNFLAENQLTRTDILIALGGGVVGDLTGFAAACYLRGIDYVQIPTTLLAMVDSSVGGKTAINLPAGKNLAGAFYQPCLVLCDTNALDKLPADSFTDGCAEVIKYGILFDDALFRHLEEFGANFDREYVISRCITLKRDVVINDERDNSTRKLLNFGHTVAHAIEKASQYSISHGKAVAMGMTAITKSAAACKICSAETYHSVKNILQSFGLPISLDIPCQTLIDGILLDKKRSRDQISLIIPRDIGNCFIQDFGINEARVFIQAGL